MTALEKWKNDFKEFISELSIPRDDYKGIMEYINEVPNEALEQQPCEDAISRQAVLDSFWKLDIELRPCAIDAIVNMINNLPSVTPNEKIGYCKDCKWWKDNDGVYRRGIGAESKCPINCKKVYEGNGYCFMFEPQESEDKE